MIKAKCIFVGELHNRIQDHEAQLAIIKALNASGIPLAIGLEMFRKNDQGKLDLL